MSVIYGHPVVAATRALCFADHMTKRNGGSSDENVAAFDFMSMRRVLYSFRILIQSGFSDLTGSP